MIQIIFNIVASFFILWMAGRWSTGSTRDSLIKTVLFIVGFLGLTLVAKGFNII